MQHPRTALASLLCLGRLHVCHGICRVKTEFPEPSNPVAEVKPRATGVAEVKFSAFYPLVWV